MEYESLLETLGHAARKIVESWQIKSITIGTI